MITTNHAANATRDWMRGIWLEGPHMSSIAPTKESGSHRDDRRALREMYPYDFGWCTRRPIRCGRRS